MESHGRAPPPAIRTAMRMSRYNSPTLKPTEIPNFAASLCLSDEIAEDESVQSAKLRSLPSVPDRSRPWGQYRETLRSQLYQDWEKDECVLEEEVAVQHTALAAAKPAIDLRQPKKRLTLFRPQPIKTAKSSTIPCVRPTMETHPKVLSSAGLRKHCKPACLPPLQAVSPQLSVTSKAQDLYPVVRLTIIESEELVESPVESAFEQLRVRKSPKMVEKPAETQVQRGNEGRFSLKTKYCEETAAMLGNTSSLARRRSDRMIVAERLFRHI